MGSGQLASAGVTPAYPMSLPSMVVGRDAGTVVRCEAAIGGP